jgi:hypothetical protein
VRPVDTTVRNMLVQPAFVTQPCYMNETLASCAADYRQRRRSTALSRSSDLMAAIIDGRRILNAGCAELTCHFCRRARLVACAVLARYCSCK